MQIICRDIDFRSEREEEFYQISVDVKGKGSLDKSLESYVQVRGSQGERAGGGLRMGGEAGWGTGRELEEGDGHE